MISTSDIERDFFLGFIKVHVLHHAGEAPVYGTAVIEELAHHGYRVGPSLIYPLLHQLEVEGYLSRTDQPVSGKVRKYYTLTSAGARALDDIKGKIAELVAEVIESHPPDAPVPLSIDEVGEAVHILGAQIQILGDTTLKPELDRTLGALALLESTITAATRPHAEAERVATASVLQEIADQLATLRQKTERIAGQAPGAAMDAVVRALALAQQMMTDRPG